MRIFISGKITGDNNYKANFATCEKALRTMGYSVCNPVREGERLKATLGREPTYEEYLQYDLRQLSFCEGITMLDNWQDSNGSKIEHDYAVKHNIPVICVKLIPRGWN